MLLWPSTSPGRTQTPHYREEDRRHPPGGPGPAPPPPVDTQLMPLGLGTFHKQAEYPGALEITRFCR